MTALKPELVVDGYKFPESPRWWDDSLYFSDVYGRKVFRMKADGSNVEEVAHLEGMPSGLGQLPDGSRVIVELTTRKLWKLPALGGSLQPFADLTSLSNYWLNDLITARDGFTYTGCYGHDLLAGDEPAPGTLVLTDPAGNSRIVADGLMMPNGMAISEDGRTLLIAETFGARITAFDRHEDGSLSNRRVWADLPGTRPDGLCLDAEGGIWLGSCFTGEFLRVEEGGRITHRLPVPGRWALATYLGGSERRTLYLMSTETDFERVKENDMHGRIEAVEVDVPGVGLP